MRDELVLSIMIALEEALSKRDDYPTRPPI
jgi:hypothetical protein